MEASTFVLTAAEQEEGGSLGTAASWGKGNFRDGSALRVCWVSPAVVFKLYSSDLNIEMEVRSCVSVPVSRISDGWCLGLEERWLVG